MTDHAWSEASHSKSALTVASNQRWLPRLELGLRLVIYMYKYGSADVKRSVIMQLPGQTLALALALALVTILVEPTAPNVSADLLREASGSCSACGPSSIVDS